jgi:hypothetical protein
MLKPKILIKYLLTLMLLLIVVFIFHPKESREYLKPTLGACDKSTCIGLNIENCYGTHKCELGEFQKCNFRCFGLLIEPQTDCTDKIKFW